MSYNVMLAPPPVPADDAEAWAHVNALADASYEDDRPATPQLVAAHDALTSRYPCICDLADDVVDDEGVWSDGPLINNFCHDIAIVGVVYSRVEEVIPFIEKTAMQAGLVFFDPQREYIRRPE